MTRTQTEAIVIGASAGAVEALSRVLPPLAERYALPIMIVVHLPNDKRSVLVELFQAKCRMRVQEAEDKEPIEAGTIYFAPPDYHLLVEQDKTLSLSSDDPVLYSRPSIDVLFESAADAYGPGLLGIILTGANQDGANGLKAVAAAGGEVIIQSPETAFVSTMPMAAFEACPDARLMPLDDITIFLQRV